MSDFSTDRPENSGLFVRRVTRLYTEFVQKNSTLFGKAQFLLLQRGKIDTAQSNRLVSHALYEWLFEEFYDASLFHDAVLCLSMDGSLWMAPSGSASALQSALERRGIAPGSTPPITIRVLARDKDIRILDQLWNVCGLPGRTAEQEGGDDQQQSPQQQQPPTPPPPPPYSPTPKVLAFFSDEHERNLAATGLRGNLERRLQSLYRTERMDLQDVSPGVLATMFVQEEAECSATKHASKLASTIVQRHFLDTILDAFDDESDLNRPRTTHLTLSQYLDEMITDREALPFPTLTDDDTADATFEPCYDPVVQSGGRFYDMTFHGRSTDQPIRDDVVTVSLGIRYQRCTTTLSRTFLFNPTLHMRESYQLLLDLRRVCMAAMVPGNVLKNVYESATTFLADSPKYAHLRHHLPVSLGFGMAPAFSAFKNDLLCLTSTNLEVFRSGMAFCLKLFFECANSSSTSTEDRETSMLLLSDTIYVTDDSASLLTDAACRLSDIAFEEEVDVCLNDTLETSAIVPFGDEKTIEQTVQNICDDVLAEEERSDYDRLQELLRSKCDRVVEKFAPRQSSRKRKSCPQIHPIEAQPSSSRRLESSMQGELSIRYHRKGRTSSASTLKRTISTIEDPLPKHTFYVPIEKSYWVPDTSSLLFIPTLDDASDMEQLLSMHNTEYRERLIDYGSESHQEKMSKRIDSVLARVARSAKVRPTKIPKVSLRAIAESIGEDFERVQERLNLVKTTNPKKMLSSESGLLNDNFQEAIDSYRTLWCPSCYIYDCNAHGINEKVSSSVQLKMALQKEKGGLWAEPQSAGRTVTELRGVKSAKKLSNFQKVFCKQLFELYEGDISKIAMVLRAPEYMIANFATTRKLRVPSVKPVAPNLSVPYFSVKNYKLSWYNKYRNAEIFAYCSPCNHDDVCNEKTCSCVQNKFFCTKACGWAEHSPNFFRGCECKGACIRSNCTCYAAKRECDPNLCKCTTCSDPPNELITKQLCRNDNMVMQRSAARALLIGRSSVEAAGWGLFTKYALKAGDFVCEYVGEAISQEEAERRGMIDDARNSSYLFMVASDLVLDGSRKGNVSRFINHSDKPNVQPRIVFVRGEQRIGMWAISNIAAQEELFFDYSYQTFIDNDVVLQTPATNVKWMESKKPLPRAKKQIASKKK